MSSDQALLNRIASISEPSPGALMSQQFWFLGQDPKNRADNLLVRFGFLKEPPPDEFRCASRYTWRGSAGTVVLWAFGVLARQGECGIFLSRSGFNPIEVEAGTVEGLWRPDDVHAVVAAVGAPCETQAHLVPWLAAFFERYEHWVEEHAGAEYRKQCVERWHRTGVAPKVLRDRWCEIAGLRGEASAA